MADHRPCADFAGVTLAQFGGQDGGLAVVPLDPLIHPGGCPCQPTWPEPVHQHPAAISGVRLVVNAPDVDLAAGRHQPACLLRARNAVSRSIGQVLITSSVLSQPRWAVPAPYRMFARWPIAWASLSMENLAPWRSASRTCSARAASRSG